MIGAATVIAAALSIEVQQRLRDPRFNIRLMVEVRDEALDNLAYVDARAGLDSHIDFGAIVAGEPSQAIERLADRIQSGECDFQGALLLGLSRDLIDAIAQLEIGAAERLLRR
jgi:hypothetical protein